MYSRSQNALHVTATTNQARQMFLRIVRPDVLRVPLRLHFRDEALPAEKTPIACLHYGFSSADTGSMIGTFGAATRWEL